VQWTRYLPFAVGAVAIVGLAATLLPLWSLTLQPADLGLEDPGGQSVSGSASVGIGIYDWILSARPVAAAIPVAFALAIAASATQLLRGDDRTLWGAVSAAALSAIAVVVFTAISPETDYAVTGPLALELDTGNRSNLTEPMPAEVGIEAGFALTLTALTVLCALACWQYAMLGRRRPIAP
jgi:hypothetical protein